MSKKRARRSTQHVHTDEQGWQETPFSLPSALAREMAEVQETITFCALCDATDVTYTVCLAIMRPDLGLWMAEQHIFGVCDQCKERYNAEEMEIILLARFGTH